MVERHQRRVDPGLTGPALRAAGAGRLPVLRPLLRRVVPPARRSAPAELDARLHLRGLRARRAARSHAGTGPHPAPAPPRQLGVGGVLADPGAARPGHRGGRAHRPAGPVRLVRRASGERIGMHDRAARARGRARVVGAVKPGHVVALLCDRDIGRQRRRGRRSSARRPRCRPARRCWPCAPGAPLLPSAVYDRGRGHHGVVRPPLPVERRGSSATTSPASPRPGRRARGADPRRARAVAPAPAQLASDRGRRAPGPALSRRRRARALRWARAHRARLPLQPHRAGGRPGAGARAWPARCARWAYDVRVLAPCDGPPPDAGVTPLGKSVPDRLQRLGRPAGARPRRPAAHHPGPAGRGLRRPPPARAAGARARR